MSSIGTPLMWSLFAALVVLALAIDFVALNKQDAHKVSMREAFVWSLHERFHLLSYGLAVVLLFIGARMLLIDIYKIPVAASLTVTAAILATSMVLSQLIPPTARPRTAYPFARKKSEAADRPRNRGP